LLDKLPELSQSNTLIPFSHAIKRRIKSGDRELAQLPEVPERYRTVDELHEEALIKNAYKE
jgi:hypothetical protein